MGVIAGNGEFNKRVTLQAPAPDAVDERGQASGAYVDVATVWAKKEPLRGREFFAAGQQQAVAEVRFVVRWRADVLASWRVVEGGVAYDLIAPAIDTLGKGVQLELMTARAAGAGVA